MTNEEKKETIEIKTDMSIEQFFTELQRLDKLGRESTLKHQELYPAPKDKENKAKGGRRYHVAGSDAKCPHCKPVIESFEAFQRLQAEQIGMTGIPMSPLLSAIKITRATILMMKNGGEI